MSGPNSQHQEQVTTTPILSAMPYEIISEIMDRTQSDITTICLGLTCTRFYAISHARLKGVKVSLTACSDCEKYDGCEIWLSLCRSTTPPLHALLTNWVESRYEFDFMDPWTLSGGYFLNKEKYPSDGRDLQARYKLRERYRTYYYLIRQLERNKDLERFCNIPSPFNMGDEWYLAMEKEIASAYESGPLSPEWLDIWRELWKRCMVFDSDNVQKAIDDYQWRMWSEGIALMKF